jgi:hypothetical protein
MLGMRDIRHGITRALTAACRRSNPSAISTYGRSQLNSPCVVIAWHSTASYIQHLWTAHASGAELQTQLLVGSRIEIISEADAAALIEDAMEVGRMLNGLVTALERSR